MAIKTQVMTADGFDRSVAEKMPKMKKSAESPPPEDSKGFLPLEEISAEEPLEGDPLRASPEKRVSPLPSSPSETPPGQDLEVLKLIEDLHTQLLVSSRTQKALEMDLGHKQKTLHQLTLENKALKAALENEKRELQKYKEAQTELAYLKEENDEALRKLREVQQELKATREELLKALSEKEEALARVRELEAQIEMSELSKIKGRMNEREISYIREENRELQARLEETFAQKTELEQRYEALKRSFNEIKESLTLLRDSYKQTFYSLSANPE
ncbi:MAG: hypothetical protein N3G78_07880 [Desulfobacterota bacterium]|nr:hypothetical protein [Thermodesulfobacteriota bacterium]